MGKIETPYTSTEFLLFLAVVRESMQNVGMVFGGFTRFLYHKEESLVAQTFHT